ncbi:MAG TPA: SAM-dependent methyltransferase [Candidatus Babeliales bacterium]|nr:SAM-dependent methyltransferase [Candidatus Babeliales bacterium]
MNTPLAELMRETIRAKGPQSFACFMQQALYHPEHGYYSSGRCVIGRNGDYFTNVSVGSVFGQLLVAQFHEIWERLGRTNDFVIIEQGSHDGQFALDVLEFAQTRFPEFFDALRYQIIEPFPKLEQQQRQKLEAFGGKVTWPDSLQPFTGVHFSNELLDAMPVRLIRDGTEKLVGLDDDNFVFVERPQGTTASQPSGDNSAFNQAALELIDQIAANLQRGYVIAIDYGFLDEQFERDVQIRARHRNLDSPFDQIGCADITTSVHWRSIAERAQANRLRVAGFTDQHHFLTGIISRFESYDPRSVTDAKQRPGVPSVLGNSPKAKRELQTLLHPEMLGRAFQVLALEKNVDRETKPLAGFKFATESPSALRLTDPVL